MTDYAEKLNSILSETPVYSMLSDFGRRMYIPVGFPEQSQQANREATNFNATAGVAKEYGQIMYLNLIREFFSDKLSPSEIFDYCPMAGNTSLRNAWKEDLLKKNPSLRGKKFSLPVVTGGITNSLSTALSLFVDKSDSVILPNLYWENYRIMVEQYVQGNMVTFPLLNDFGMDLESFEKAVSSVDGEKIVIILNFPNNPTGYSPTCREAEEIKNILVRYAEKGKKIVLMLDDAYFSLFFSEDVCRESLFATMCNAHENILAVKLDGATKEEMVWGFRIAFITYGGKGLSESAYNALVQKTVGVIRSVVSSCNAVSQSILVKALADPRLESERANGVERVRRHYIAFTKALEKFKGNCELVPMPFNSGYFVTFKTRCNAEELRLKLLDEHKGGIIRIDDHRIRFAYCSIDPERMEEVLSTVYTVASQLN